MREYAKSDKFHGEYTTLYEKLNAEEYCNLCITLINQATYMLRRLIDKQQQLFVEQGGISEQMTRARIEYRNKNLGGSRTGQTCRTSRTGQTGQTK